MAGDTQHIRNALRQMLLDYRKIRPNLSLRAIARNSGVNRYFLNKLLDETDTSPSIDLDEMLSFCRFISKTETLQDTISVQITEIQEYLSRFIPSISPKDLTQSAVQTPQAHHFVDKDTDLYDRENFLLMLLSCCDESLSPQEIIEILGESCKPALDDMLKSGTLVLNEDQKLLPAKGKNIYFTASQIRHHMPEITRFYTIRHRGMDRNFIFLAVQSLNQAALKELVEIQHAYASKVLNLTQDKNNWGPNPVFLTTCMDSFRDELK